MSRSVVLNLGVRGPLGRLPRMPDDDLKYFKIGHNKLKQLKIMLFLILIHLIYNSIIFRIPTVLENWV